MTEATFIILDVGPSEPPALRVTTPQADRDVFYIHFATASGNRLQHPLTNGPGFY